MAASGGAPWWVTVVLMLVSAGVTHTLTVWRERRKVQREKLSNWECNCLSLVGKITDSAIEHYVDHKSFDDTPKSAALILSDLKRLGQLLREFNCVMPPDMKVTMDNFRAYHSAITGPEDFQDVSRVGRAASDLLCEAIRDIESSLKDAIKKPRIKK